MEVDPWWVWFFEKCSMLKINPNRTFFVEYPLFDVQITSAKPGMYLSSGTVRSGASARSSHQSVPSTFPTPHSHLVFLWWPHSHLVTEMIPEKDPRLTLTGAASTPGPVIMDRHKTQIS